MIKKKVLGDFKGRVLKLILDIMGKFKKFRSHKLLKGGHKDII